nr:uncharacterized protein LOC127323671 isoform X2 [Lolium perenne]XP_051207743.1 uncharacterized protein LOC127323671 isoform X2 [Lolium perenne]
MDLLPILDRWFAAALPYVELVLVRPSQARSIASFMLQTKLSIKIILTFTTTLYWSFNTSHQSPKAPQSPDRYTLTPVMLKYSGSESGGQRRLPATRATSRRRIFSVHDFRASDPRAPIYFPDFLTVCLKICLLLLFQISSRFASRALVEKTPRKKRKGMLGMEEARY